MTPDTPTLARRLGLPTAIAVVVGSVIGAGIFLKPGNIAADAGSFPLIFSVWIAGGVLCLLGALCFAELGAMFPQAGGLYVYLREAYGKPVAFLFGWNEFIFGKPASIGALAVAFVGAIAKAMNWTLNPFAELLVVSALISGLAWVNIRGVQWGGWVQLVITLIKVVFLTSVALLPVVLAGFGRSGIEMANYSTTVVPLKSGWFSQSAAALLAVMWAYHGWHGLTPLAEEVKDPQKNLPRGLLWGVGIVTLLYLSANLAYHGAMSMSEMAAARDHAAEQMPQKLLGAAGATAMAAVIVCSTFGAINSNLLEAPRVSFAMGRDRLLFRWLGLVHVEHRTPSVAIAVTALMSIAAVAAVTLAKFAVRDVSAGRLNGDLLQRLVSGLQQGTAFQLLTNFVVFSSTVFFILCVLAVFVLRRTRPDLPRPYKTWGYPWVPAAFIAVTGPFLYQAWRSNPAEAGAGMLLILLGVPVYFGFRYAARRDSLPTSV